MSSHRSHTPLATVTPLLDKIARVAYFQPGTISDLAENAAREYSRMKYGDPDATHSLAARLSDLLLNSPEFLARVPADKRIVLAPSAYGSIPNAACALAEAIKVLLEQEGFEVLMVKFIRSGGFSRTNYGSLNFKERVKVLEQRRISLAPEDRELLKDATLLVVDDLRSTGAHERTLLDLLEKKTAVKHAVFAYLIAFNDELQNQDPMQEESINHSHISRLEDLLPFFADDHTPPYLNARVLKFILLGGLDGKGDLAKFFQALPLTTCRRIFEAALSHDGYHSRAKFLPGIRMLEQCLIEAGAMDAETAGSMRRAAESKTVLHSLNRDASGRFVSQGSRKDLGEEIGRYSRFKFGGVEEIRYFGKALADEVIRTLVGGGSLRETFEQAGQRGEYIYLQAPGYRNVVSASNFLLREVATRVNVWLSIRGLPSMIVKPLSRLASGRANYAQLSADERSTRPKATQSLIPASELREHPIHVIFLDDVEVSGVTAKRARKLCLKAGALSFHSIFAFEVQPNLAASHAAIEHEMNQARVSGRLDAEVADILSHPDYQPVQRMLRLLLHPDNRADLAAFARNQVPSHGLLRVYASAMSNDYLWINPEGDAPSGVRSLGAYGPSLVLLREVLQEEGLLDQDGLPA